MIVKYGKKQLHKTYLIVVFERVHQLNMELNSFKCMFKVKGDKFIIFYLTWIVIE